MLDLRVVSSLPSTSVRAEAAPLPAKPSLPYAPALDGLRALCVAMVILYHADVSWLGGGFLGVEVFFVLSGFLITSLLRNELSVTGRVNLIQFWKRRARRLLPALWVLLAAISLYAACFLPNEIWRLRYEVLAGFAYVANWYFSFAHYSYFEMVGRPSLLTHLWSLAIEEQFYLLWPGLFLLASRRFRAASLGVLAMVLAAASCAWMAARFTPGVDPSAIYYDSAARASAILLGASLAFLGNERIPRISAVAADLLGWCGLCGLVGACVWYSEADAFVFRGGLVLVDLCSLAVIVACVHPQARFLQRFLSFEPLRLIGTRSYGLYLWHWPVAALTRPGVDVPLDVPQTLVLRLVLSGVLTELSYRLIEEPVRSGRWFGKARSRDPQVKVRRVPRLHRAALTVGLCGLAVGTAFVAQAFVLARPPVETSFDLGPAATGALLTAAPAAVAPQAVPVESKGASSDGKAARGPDGKALVKQPRVLVVGDSVVLGAARYLRAGHQGEVDLNAEIGRTSTTTVPGVRKLKHAGKLRPVTIVHLGNNGWLFEAHVHEIVALLEGVERMVFINAHVPRRWQDHNNATLASALAEHPNAILIDWAKASEHHREFFGIDGLHLTHAGAQAFADLVTPHYSYESPASSSQAPAPARQPQPGQADR
jgi:peptidoglycan/LPS O-acetylase OafA/YrhL